ncbi:4188_t:CDS:2 [Cetraspora pellucida]|uniref:4188_t:CDS:1 n=1 Tax=Cetraspora pellucida TaxID=1433469 RepID=A0A9N9DAP5_9GLOM|nr:4188_t:CDS:2 [Cetraspora pellucida]
MKDEKRENYLWALTQVSCLFDNTEPPKVFVTDCKLALIHAIHNIFPNSKNILCRWHVEKNILTKCKESWLPLKESFISTWVDHYLHLDNTTISRVEGSYLVLKKYFQILMGNLNIVYEKISLLLENQHHEIKAMIAKDKTCIAHAQNISFYNKLIIKILAFSLRKIYEQYLKALQATFANLLEPCTNQSLNLNNIHHHWWIKDNQLLLQRQNRINDHSLLQLLQDFNQQYDTWSASQQTAAYHKLSELIKEPMLLLDPIIQQHTRGQPAGLWNKAQTSIQRISLAFELE